MNDPFDFLDATMDYICGNFIYIIILLGALGSMEMNCSDSDKNEPVIKEEQVIQ